MKWWEKQCLVFQLVDEKKIIDTNYHGYIVPGDVKDYILYTLHLHLVSNTT